VTLDELPWMASRGYDHAYFLDGEWIMFRDDANTFSMAKLGDPSQQRWRVDRLTAQCLLHHVYAHRNLER
jgi:hypothetical protein